MILSHRSGDERADRRAAYAEDYARARDFAAAADLMRQALELAPRWTLGRLRLANFLEEAGDLAGALALYADIRAEDEGDPYGAGLKIAALGAGEAPAAPSPAFVAGLFDQYAEGFEAALVGRLEYRAPDAIAGMIARVAGPSARFAHAMDLGCGTGLMGARLRALCDRLDGIDLSAGMLEVARRKRLYDTLREGDIVEALREDGPAFDLATAADVLTYLGDLSPVFSALAPRLSPGGLFAFTVEADDAAGAYAIQPSLRYAHAPALLAALGRDLGFALLAEERLVLRRDRGEPVHGAAMLLRRIG
ncbi:methyltransferase [Aurantimonas sp. Leaf443]|uniref:class I SAM-dependent DNA methyltransferase n=1 Tax=Aurantimonas sp. Leaf443 TaxID=1736378 RepID=UPI000A5F5367|nr:methyltransferase [Aurantimonas sp. Leaf443]